MYITGTYDPRWDNDVLNPAFAGLRASDFEVVELGWRPPATNPPSCAASATALCLNGARFRVEATWRTPDGRTGAAHVAQLTVDTGYLWFFEAANVEAVVKVHNGCGLNQRYWTFAGGLTNVRTVITVTDTTNGAARTYVNPQGTAFRPVQDTAAFATCP